MHGRLGEGAESKHHGHKFAWLPLAVLFLRVFPTTPAVAQEACQLRITDEEAVQDAEDVAPWPEDALIPLADPLFSEASFQEPPLRVVPRCPGPDSTANRGW